MKSKIIELFFKYRLYIIIGAIILITLLLISIYQFKFNEKDDDIQKLEHFDIVEEKEDGVSTKITIDIKGAVKNPGVYNMNRDSRVIDAINKAGGLLDTADNSIINLSKKITDEMVIIIYTKDEIGKMLEGDMAIKIIEKECICPKLENDACIDNKVTNSSEKKENISFPISINKANKEELMNLPGIGESKANAIIKYRDENGNFDKIEDIINVSGIGELVFEKIKEYICL
ncbi:MAG: helix-hairpin-helix domain-containing protein [Bacilli bacterium]